jgi:hypothetical protein
VLFCGIDRGGRQGSTRGLPGEKRAVRFDIDLAVSDAAYPTRRSRARLDAGTADRVVCSATCSPARCGSSCMKFAAPLLVGHAVGFLERHVQPGIVHITAPDPGTWTAVDRLDQLGLPTDRPVRILLFIHGTFSSTLSAFGSLAVSDKGARFLAVGCSGNTTR